MNSFTGKQILALVRGGDFAHPGETEAIDVLLGDLLPDGSRRLLDIGCGLAGTANEVHARGLGQVTGIEIDKESVDFARAKYRHIEIINADARNVVNVVRGSYNLVYFFNSLYTISEQTYVLRQVAQVCPSGAELRIFDYAVREEDARAAQYARQHEGPLWNPIRSDRLDTLLSGTGWNLLSARDISADYQRWYERLVRMIDSMKNEIVTLANEQWFHFVRGRYQKYAEVARERIVGGITLRAVRSSAAAQS